MSVTQYYFYMNTVTVTSFPSTGSPSKENPYAASIWLSSPASAVHRLESHY